MTRWNATATGWNNEDVSPYGSVAIRASIFFSKLLIS
jgi:hypothetical protein